MFSYSCGLFFASYEVVKQPKSKQDCVRKCQAYLELINEVNKLICDSEYNFLTNKGKCHYNAPYVYTDFYESYKQCIEDCISK